MQIHLIDCTGYVYSNNIIDEKNIFLLKNYRLLKIIKNNPIIKKNIVKDSYSCVIKTIIGLYLIKSIKVLIKN